MSRLTDLYRCLFPTLLGLLLVLGTVTAAAVERVTYYHNDALGSPVAATDAGGTLLWREEYQPYGSRIKREAGSKDTAWYTGKQEESATGLSYFGARWYDPAMGRFMAMDPAGFTADNVASFSKYAYANNNPYVYVDPDGNFAILGAVIAAVADIATQGLLISAGAQHDFSLGSIVVAAGLGAATGGLVNLKKAYDAGKILNNARKGIKSASDTERAVSSVKYITKPGSKVQNIRTDVSKAEFENNLLNNGFTKTTSKDGKVSNFISGDKRYSTRSSSDSTNGPTAEAFKSNEKVSKIRLGE